MGLSSFNAMRARMKAEAKVLGNSGAKVEVKEVKPESEMVQAKTEVESAEESKVDESDESESKPKKTDAEKLKKRKD